MKQLLSIILFFSLTTLNAQTLTCDFEVNGQPIETTLLHLVNDKYPNGKYSYRIDTYYVQEITKKIKHFMGFHGLLNPYLKADFSAMCGCHYASEIKPKGRKIIEKKGMLHFFHKMNRRLERRLK